MAFLASALVWKMEYRGRGAWHPPSALRLVLTTLGPHGSEVTQRLSLVTTHVTVEHGILEAHLCCSICGISRPFKAAQHPALRMDVFADRSPAGGPLGRLHR